MKNIPKKNSRVMPFSKVPNGALFKALKPEMHHGRICNNDGVYIKMADSYSVVANDEKHEVIFARNMPCRVLSYRPSNLPHWKMTLVSWRKAA